MSGVGGHLLGSVSHVVPVQDSGSPYLGQRQKGRWGGGTWCGHPCLHLFGQSETHGWARH